MKHTQTHNNKNINKTKQDKTKQRKEKNYFGAIYRVALPLVFCNLHVDKLRRRIFLESVDNKKICVALYSCTG